MDAAKLQSIQISDTQRRRSGGSFWWILIIVLGATGTAFYFANPWAKDSRDMEKTATPAVAAPEATAAAPKPKAPDKPGDVLLTVSGYIVNRERIEIGPRVINQVRWIGVKKGDTVKKDQVVVQLDDSEQKARIAEIEGQIAVARVAVKRAKMSYDRVSKLRVAQIETAEREDETRLAVVSAEAQIQQLEGLRATAQVFLDWTIIKSPIDGVVLEKLADPGELVTPQSFGGGKGPSTALLALADPNDLQVEIDINENDLPKIALKQRCRISPEAYLDKVYQGYVAEIAPEANRQKGTLQIKVQIEKPDHFLTPELSAKVDFIK